MRCRSFRATPGVIPLILFLLAGAPGCSQAGNDRSAPATSGPLERVSVSTQDILQRCAAAYSRGRTFHIIGVLKDYRPGKNRVVPVLWEFARGGRCKLQIDMSVALILGEDCWIYTPERGRFLKQRRFSRTPVQTASYLLSDGIAMLLPELCMGVPVFEGYQAMNWRLEGTGWSGGRPCYVVSLSQDEQDLRRNLVLWIDQGDYLLREWAIVIPGRDAPDKAIVECDFSEIVVDGSLGENAFALETPVPVRVARESPTSRPGGS